MPQEVKTGPIVLTPSIIDPHRKPTIQQQSNKATNTPGENNTYRSPPVAEEPLKKLGSGIAQSSLWRSLKNLLDELLKSSAPDSDSDPCNGHDPFGDDPFNDDDPFGDNSGDDPFGDDSDDDLFNGNDPFGDDNGDNPCPEHDPFKD